VNPTVRFTGDTRPGLTQALLTSEARYLVSMTGTPMAIICYGALLSSVQVQFRIVCRNVMWTDWRQTTPERISANWKRV